jgi:hypothetical protein
MKLIFILSGLISLVVIRTDAQGLSAFPDDPPELWGGVGIGFPDVSLSVPLNARFFPLLLRPQLDFGFFQRHGHAVRGGKISLGYISPFSVLGIGNAIIGAIGGYNIDRLTDRQLQDGQSLVEEEEIFMWGGFLGEILEVYDNVFITLEIRLLNQEVTTRAVDPAEVYIERTGRRFRTTWMIGVHVLLW